MVPSIRQKFTLKTEFPVDEFDINGRVIDKGDDDYKPSHKFKGGMVGFEFKLGERGLGYYRTVEKLQFGV